MIIDKHARKLQYDDGDTMRLQTNYHLTVRHTYLVPSANLVLIKPPENILHDLQKKERETKMNGHKVRVYINRSYPHKVLLVLV